MLFSYKMTHDTGFAPNPFYGVLSLANCKPQIRLKKKVGDYIAGFTSKRLCGEKVGEERLVFFMKVSQKLSYFEYFNDERYKNKIPNKSSLMSEAGDNIYMPDPTENGGFIQLANPYHVKDEMDHDLSGKFVLISHEFFYFGSGAIPIFRSEFNIKVPKYQSAHGVKTDNDVEIQKLYRYLSKSYKANIAIHAPHSWKKGEPFN